MQSRRLVGIVGGSLSLAVLAASSRAVVPEQPTPVQLRSAPLEGGSRPKPTPKRGKPTKAEKKAAKRARNRASGAPPLRGEGEGVCRG